MPGGQSESISTSAYHATIFDEPTITVVFERGHLDARRRDTGETQIVTINYIARDRRRTALRDTLGVIAEPT